MTSRVDNGRTRRTQRVLAVVVTALLASASVAQEPATREPRAPRTPRTWEHETSDVPVDPRIRFGRLDNGLRWAWAVNAEPDQRAYLRMHVDAGSWAEEEGERGIAHFLEHMAFNGSRHFPAGTLVEWFQRHGMAFGADTNATTGYSETIYKLDLPRSDEETLQEGLRVLADFAHGLLLEPDEIEAEKPVVDAEERERDSPARRVHERKLEVLYAGTRYAQRLPIGVKEDRDAFTADSVRAFYERWYRPENVTLVLVGDLGELDPEPLFAEHFGGWEAPDTAPAREPDVGSPPGYSHFFSILEPELPAVTITAARLKPWEEEPFTVAELVGDLPLVYARHMIGIRFWELSQEEGTPFLRAALSSARSTRGYDGERLTISCAPENWKEALGVCEQELRRALLHGFHPAELEEVRAEVLRGLDESVEREKTAYSTSLLAEILAAAESRYVPTDAATTRSIVRPVIEALTVEACHEALVEAWGGGELSIYASGALDLGEDGGAELRRAWERSREVEVSPGEDIVVGEFAYASSPERTGEVVERTHVEDLDFHALRFANGVAVNVKKTDFKEKQILVQAWLGEGKLTNEPNRRGAVALGWVTDQVFDRCGLGAHSEDDLRRITAGKTAGVGFSVGEDAFTLGGATTAEDLLLQCELMCAYLTDPGWRDDGIVPLRRWLPQFFEGLKHQHTGPYLREFLPALHPGDPRAVFPGQEELAGVGNDEIEAWLAPHLAAAPLEVTFVGDLDVEATVEAAARTFGALGERRGLRSYDERRDAVAARPGLRQEHEIDTEVPKTMVLAVYPTTDGIDAERRHALAFLASVLSDRLRVAVREELGAAYSPSARAESSTVYPGRGTITVHAMADPGDVDRLLETCVAVADGLATDGVTAEEVERVREPVLNGLRDAMRTNGFWIGAIGEAHRRPATLDDARGVVSSYERVSAEDLTPLAERYLKRERASVLIVRPRGAQAETGPNGHLDDAGDDAVEEDG